MGLLEKLIPPMGQARFARKALAISRSASRKDDLTFDQETFSLRNARGEGVINLSNLYVDYCRSSLLNRKLVFHKLAAIQRTSGQETKLNWEADRNSFLPRLRDLSYFDIVSLQLGGLSIPHRAISNELGFELVHDTPSACMTLMDRQLNEIGRTFDEIWPVARDNLYRISLRRYVEIEPGIFASPYADSHDAARMLMPDLLRDIPIAGTIVGAFIRAELVLLCSKSDADAIRRIAEKVTAEMELGGRTITGNMFELQNGHWELLSLPADHPAYWLVRKNQRINALRDYNAQLESLNKQFAEKQRDCYVAKLDMVGYSDSPVIWTWSVWVEGISDTLLPKCDVVILGIMAEPKPFGHVLWDDLIRVAGHRMVAQGQGLVRYHLTSFPSTEELAALPLVSRNQIKDSLLANANRS